MKSIAATNTNLSKRLNEIGVRPKDLTMAEWDLFFMGHGRLFVHREDRKLKRRRVAKVIPSCGPWENL